jgi:hypothetical protein
MALAVRYKLWTLFTPEARARIATALEFVA